MAETIIFQYLCSGSYSKANKISIINHPKAISNAPAQ